MTEQPDKPELPADVMKMLANMMSFIENLGTITAGMQSFRQQLEASGYSPTMAEQIAAEMHVLMLRKVFG